MTLSLSSLGINSTTSTTSVSKQGLASSRESAGVGEATSVDLSKPGELLAALQNLKDANPDTFSSVVSKLAQEVGDQAKNSTGLEQKGLVRLASQLDKVAQSGDLSALQPPQGGHRARGARAYPPPDAANDGDSDDTRGSTGAAASSQPTDPRAAMDAVLEGLIKQVQAATSSTTSSELASSTVPASTT